MGKKVSETCMDTLLIEMVSIYCDRFYSNKLEHAARLIEAIGCQVGNQLSERYTIDGQRFADQFETIKFLCKDFWLELFKKPIDNLKTNNRGTFMLQDNNFRWLAHISLHLSSEAFSTTQGASESESKSSGENKVAQATSMYLYFPCGIIRGALTNLGLPCAVSADISNHPACSFVIRIKA